MSSTSFLDSTGATVYAETTGAGTQLDPFRFVKVEPASTVPEADLIMEYVENTGSNILAVDGSVTPVTFSQPTVIPVGGEVIIWGGVVFFFV